MVHGDLLRWFTFYVTKIFHAVFRDYEFYSCNVVWPKAIFWALYFSHIFLITVQKINYNSLLINPLCWTLGSPIKFIALFLLHISGTFLVNLKLLDCMRSLIGFFLVASLMTFEFIYLYDTCVIRYIVILFVNTLKSWNRTLVCGLHLKISAWAIAYSRAGFFWTHIPQLNVIFFYSIIFFF